MRIIIEIDSPGTGNVSVTRSEGTTNPSPAVESASGVMSSLQLTATNAGPAPTRGGADGAAIATPGAPAVEPEPAHDEATSAGAAPT